MWSSSPLLDERGAKVGANLGEDLEQIGNSNNPGKTLIEHVLQVVEERPLRRPERAVGEAFAQFLPAAAEQALDDLGRVVADQRAGAMIEGWRRRHLEWRVLNLAPAQHRMVELPVHATVAQLRVVLDAVLGTLDGHGSHAGGLAARGDVVLAERARPGLDVAVERLLVLEPAAVRSVALIS